MTRRLYATRLSGKLGALGYFADKFIDAKTEYDGLSIITRYIIPFIRRSKACRHFIFQCVADRDRYYNRWRDCETHAPREVESTYISLKSYLKKYDLLNNGCIQSLIAEMDEVLLQRAMYRMPPYIEVLDDKIKELLTLLLELGYLNIVEPYAVIDGINDRFGVEGKNRRAFIKENTYAPSLVELKELNTIFSWDRVEDVWVAWEYFILLDWCWNTPFSFFDDKQPKYDNYNSAIDSNKLYVLHDEWCLINELKKGKKQALICSVFNRKYFQKYLELILDHLILEQAVSAVQGDDTYELNKTPYSIELNLQDLRLFLEVCWFDHGGSKSYYLQTFRNESGPYKCMRSLFDFPGDMVDVRKNGYSGMNTSKIINSIYKECSNFLMKIFFEKDKSNATYKISLKNQPILCSNLSKKEQRELVRHLSQLQEMPRTAGYRDAG